MKPLLTYVILRNYLLVALLLALAGCAGKDFVRPSSDKFQLGQATYSQVIQTMGEPRNSGNVEKNGKQINSISYAYASVGGQPFESGVTPARAQSYFFHDGILVGKEFVSSFKSDSSFFDETKTNRLRKGETTRSEAIQIMGAPTASYVAPMVKESSGEAIGYAYMAVRGGPFSGFKTLTKILRISFDTNNVIADIEFASSGTK